MSNSLALVIPLIDKINKYIVNPLILLLIALAVFTFLYGLAGYMRTAGDDGGNPDAKQHMLWGIIGLFIMVSVYGILQIVCGTVGCN